MKNSRFSKGYGEILTFECQKCHSVRVSDFNTILTPAGFVKFQTTFEHIVEEDKV